MIIKKRAKTVEQPIVEEKSAEKVQETKIEEDKIDLFIGTESPNSKNYVKTHIYNIFRKMNVKSRVGVIYIVNEENEDELPRH